MKQLKLNRTKKLFLYGFTVVSMIASGLGFVYHRYESPGNYIEYIDLATYAQQFDSSLYQDVEIKSSGTNTFTYKDPKTGETKPLAGGKQIKFIDCSASHQNHYLGIISVIQDHIFPDPGLSIKCEKILGGSASGAIEDPIKVGCILENGYDIDNSHYPRSRCDYVFAHETTHKRQIVDNSRNGKPINESGDSSNEEFNKVTGCVENPLRNLLGLGHRVLYLLERSVSMYGLFMNCEEGYADAVAYYITQGCWVRDNRPKQYEWLRNNVFDGKEFCNK